MTIYVTLAEAAGYIGTEIAADDPDVDVARRVASRDVENWCQRDFGVPTSATSRTFVPVFGASLLHVHDISSTSGLVIVEDGVTLAASAYQLETSPGETSQTGPTGEFVPYQWIRLLDDWWETDNGRATVTVTARWGWPATPDAVTLATLMLTRDLFVARRASFGVQTFGQDGFTRRITQNPLVVEMLAPYRSSRSQGVA